MPRFDYPLILAALIETNDPRKSRDYDPYRTAWRVLHRQQTTSHEVLEHYGLKGTDLRAFVRSVFEQGPFADKGWIKTGAAASCARYLEGVRDGNNEFFCGFDGAFPVAVELALAGHDVDFACESGPENELFNLVAGLTQLCGRGRIRLQSADMIESGKPSFIALEYNGRATGEAPSGSFLRELLTRFRSDGTLVFTSSTLLWHTTRDAELLREELVRRQRLAAVVKLPYALSASAVYGSALLLLTEHNDTGSVEFLDYSGLKLKPDESNAWTIPFEELGADSDSGSEPADDGSVQYDLLMAHMAESWKKDSRKNQTISFAKLASNGNLLDMKRYGSMTADGIASLLTPRDGNRVAYPLSEIADITRALTITDEGTGPAYTEVMQGDIDRFGFISGASKQIRTATNVGERRARQAALREQDIVLALRGSAGMVGYVLQTEERMIAGQQFVIIRPKKDLSKSFPPSYLFRYLKSGIIQEYLKTRSLGEKLPRLKIGDVESIPVIKPAADTLRADQVRFERQLKARAEIHERIKTIRDNELSTSIFSYLS